ncbi:hypothetical protein [Yimella sp. cx-51]|uniref:hypothetical protein n=1 Tax=Yimella sp. cx-51 TaxID=2770551 RepID=UPI00165E7E59|nr:hypothetical protein [Yimella sp. cx-51]MBC9958057.1 hypothetical protein [Yimella sp. cx-51]QTH38172.1 hypothetical protein J5M86_00265 [Yimella sp. cx-51]
MNEKTMKLEKGWTTHNDVARRTGMPTGSPYSIADGVFTCGITAQALKACWILDYEKAVCMHGAFKMSP